MTIVPFEPRFESEVVDLIIRIQRDEFGIDITAEQQPDLRSIPSFYQIAGGNFWVAISEECVIGTIALLDIGAGQAALRKMFVQTRFRGPDHGVARELLQTLVSWASRKEIVEIFLGTTPFFHAAHRFYDKHGFTEIAKSGLPDSFPVMEVDKKFYHLALRDLTPS